MKLYRLISRGIGIYEAVDQDCPKSDPRRASKPDGSWLAKAGQRYPGAISFWKKAGLEAYESSGLRAWHESVLKEPAELRLTRAPEAFFYEDEHQLICAEDAVAPYRIRVAREGDARPVSRVHVACWQEAYAGIIPDSYLASLTTDRREAMWSGLIQQMKQGKSANRLLVAEAPDGELIGFACAGPARDAVETFDSEVSAIYLKKAHHGEGVGSALMREQMRWLSAQGKSRMMLWVLESNPTRSFYENIGGGLIAVLSKRVEIGGAELVEVAYGWDLG